MYASPAASIMLSAHLKGNPSACPTSLAAAPHKHRANLVKSLLSMRSLTASLIWSFTHTQAGNSSAEQSCYKGCFLRL